MQVLGKQHRLLLLQICSPEHSLRQSSVTPQPAGKFWGQAPAGTEAQVSGAQQLPWKQTLLLPEHEHVMLYPQPEGNVPHCPGKSIAHVFGTQLHVPEMHACPSGQLFEQLMFVLQPVGVELPHSPGKFAQVFSWQQLPAAQTFGETQLLAQLIVPPQPLSIEAEQLFGKSLHVIGLQQEPDTHTSPAEQVELQSMVDPQLSLRAAPHWPE